MEQFIISPDDCLILRAFKDVASLREAAQVLNCDPAGLLRKVQRISDEHGFLQKVNNRWTLTSSGKVLVVWVEESIERQKKALLGNQAIRIASTAWITEQFLIPNLKNLKDKMDMSTNFDFSTPLKKYEDHLLEGACDYVIVCHPPDDPAIAHRQLFKEEWIVVIPASWKEKNKRLMFEDLLKKPFIRHAQVNPDIFGLNSSKLSLMTSLIVDNLIAVRSGVLKGHGWSVVPRILVDDLIKERKLVPIPHHIEMDRKLCLWWHRSRSEPKKKAGTISSWLIENFERL